MSIRNTGGGKKVRFGRIGQDIARFLASDHGSLGVLLSRMIPHKIAHMIAQSDVDEYGKLQNAKKRNNSKKIVSCLQSTANDHPKL